MPEFMESDNVQNVEEIEYPNTTILAQTCGIVDRLVFTPNGIFIGYRVKFEGDGNHKRLVNEENLESCNINN